MRSPLLLTAAMAACFLLTSCASSPPVGTGLPKPLPAASRELCPQPAPAPPLSGEVDAVAEALQALYDLYGICAGRLFDLVNRLDGGGSSGR